MKLCIVFNICGISGRENVNYYISSIKSILNQEFDDFRIVISSCLSSPFVIETLLKEFGDSVSYNFINEVLPVNITFNQTAIKFTEEFGTPEAYLYVDSGIFLGEDKFVLNKLYDLHKSGPFGMTAARVDSDSGIFQWFNEGENAQDENGQENLFKNGHFIIPIGKTTNLHLQLFDKSIFNAFDSKILPDIFASHCTESTFSFINASLNKKFVLHKDVIVHHYTSMDGASSGFRPEYAKVPGWQHLLPFGKKTIFDIINNPEALECGFGYEECQNILNHSPELYNSDGFVEDPNRLRNFISENIYLSESEFDYNKIQHYFIK